MSVYTPPALNAVDSALEAVTPADITPAVTALTAYTAPALNAVDFALVAYTPPAIPYVGWELLPTGGGTVTGDLAATDGADTAAFVGDISHAGVLAATDGADTALFVGDNCHVGSLFAVESGDSCAFAGVIVPRIRRGGTGRQIKGEPIRVSLQENSDEEDEILALLTAVNTFYWGNHGDSKLY